MAEAPVLFKDAVPEEYRSAGYLKDLLDKPWEEARPAFFKKMHNAQELLGKKAGIPAAEAPEEEWTKFLDGLKPSKPEDYQVPVKEGAKVDPQFVKALQYSLFDGQLNQKQAQKFMARFAKEMEAYSGAQTKTQADAKAKSDADFAVLAKAALGEQNKPKFDRAWKLIEENAPAPLKAYIAGLPPEQRVVMTGVINAIAEKYMSEDDLNPKGKTDGDGGAGKRAQAKALMAELQKMKGFEADYDDKRVALKKLYQEIAAEQAGK